MLVGIRRLIVILPRTPMEIQPDLSPLGMNPTAQVWHLPPLLENVPAGQREQSESVTNPNPGMLQRQTVT